MSALSSPSSQTLLITGSNGFIAQHIVKAALEKGYNVKGTVRSDSSAAKVKANFPKYDSQLSFVIVKDFTDPESYSNAFDGVTSVLHTASPFILKADDNVRDILSPAIKGSTSVLEAAKKYGKSVTRVIVTSSFAAILDTSKGYRPGYTYDEKDWNPTTYDEAAVASAGVAYSASKGLAEKAMWDWIAEKQPPFTLTAINPAWVFGPSVSDDLDLGHLNTSTGAMWNLVDAKEVPPFDFGAFVDVRTLAQAHILAVENPAAAGERFLVAEHFDWQAAADVARAEMPEIKSRIPEGQAGHSLAEEVYIVNGSKAKKVLGLEYTPLNVTVKDTVAQLLAVEKATKA
jgi:NADPH-dependent methylglyoxal reductase